MKVTSLKNWDIYIPCKKNGFFASSKNVFKNWPVGELLVILINRDAVSVSKIKDREFYSLDMYWENDIFPWRIPMEIMKEYTSISGEKINESIRDILKNFYGLNYGRILQSKQSIPKKVEDKIKQLLSSHP